MDLIARMKIRERKMKRRGIINNKIFRMQKHMRRITLITLTLVTSIILMAILVLSPLDVHGQLKDMTKVDVLIFVIIIWITAYFWIKLENTFLFKQYFRYKENKIYRRYAGELHAGRRWIQFYYKGRDIGPLIPQILYYVDSEKIFKSIDEAINHIEQSITKYEQVGVNRFQYLAKMINWVIVSSISEENHPSSRVMRFVKVPDKPNVWLMASPPDTPKVREWDNSKVAIFTPPLDNGMTISSNNVTIKQMEYHLSDVSDLFKEQVRGFLDGMTDEELATELIFEMTIHSARLDTWSEHSVAIFDENGYL